MKTKVRNKKGILENFDDTRIVKAISKSATSIGVKLTEEEKEEVCLLVRQKIEDAKLKEVSVADLHGFVINALADVNSKVSISYQRFRNDKTMYEDMMNKVANDISSIYSRGDKSNANVDSHIVSAQSSLTGQVIRTALYENKLPKDILNAINEGYIYIHDRAFRDLTFNCCSCDIESILNEGFEMGNIYYSEPKSLSVAFDVIADIVMTAASQQYGGFTVPEADSILKKYAKKSYEAYLKKYLSLGVSEEIAIKTAKEDVRRDYEQGFQGWEYKFNTVASSRGDYPFITVTFGHDTDEFAVMCSLALLKVHMNGQGRVIKDDNGKIVKDFRKPVLFPKIVFLYDEELHGKDKPYNFVFEAAIDCSSKTMYPDYLSLTAKGSYVCDMYLKHGAIISPMGCRAFLSPWYKKGGIHEADENDKFISKGRMNIGVCTLNLPMIYLKSRLDKKSFHEVLDYYLQLIRQVHLYTYNQLGEKYASINELMFCEGGLYYGHLRHDQKIKEEPMILKSSTASFGYTALNELQLIYNGKTIVEDGQFAKDTLQYINDKVAEFKEIDKKLYAIYGTPAESLSSKQVEQLRQLTKERKSDIEKLGYEIIENENEFLIKGISEKVYNTNSFHCAVTEKISPIEKQDLEERFWNLSNGGKIQYCRIPLNYNRAAVKTIVSRAMQKGYYAGVNMALSYCNECGHEQLEMEVCPCCGSKDLTKIDRMNGYLSYSRIRNFSRLSDKKMQEIRDRVSM